MNTRQIPGRDKIGSLAPGKYKTFEGTEISIENCVKAKVKDLRVEGKTYQNLVSNLDELVGKVYTKKNEAKVVSNLLKVNTTYTFIINISEANYSDTNFGAIIIINYPTLSTSYVNISKKNGIFKVRYTIKEEIPKSILISPHANNDTSSSFKLNNLIILEGNYTNTDLPTSIDGIESVAERENNILSVKINDNTTPLNLPIPLRSLPNGVADTIEGNKLVQRIGKVTLDGTEEMGFYNASNYIRFTIKMPTEAKAYNKRTAVYAKGYHFEATKNEDRVIFSSAVEGANRLYIYNYDYKTVNDFKAHLTENPLEVYYELAEPVIHSLEVPSISTSKGTNIITTTNNIKPKISMKVKVKK